jgi:glycosyltransferase involved in cell wall biosynthesis
VSERILTVAHGHPDHDRGGAQVAAYQLFRAYAELPGVDGSWFLARTSSRAQPTGRIRMVGPHEYLWEQGMQSWMVPRSLNRLQVAGFFVELLRALEPTLVHAHHFVHLGLDYLKAIKSFDPSITVVLTLHEYIAICLNKGLMIKRDSGQLCYRSDIEDCSRCFPEHSPEEFWLRKHLIQAYLEAVDHFIAPSDFLRQRYLDWGIAADRISVLPNGADVSRVASQPREGDWRPNRFGFFGQVNPYKGVDVLLQALHLLPDKVRAGLYVEIHGANLERQEEAFRERIRGLSGPLEDAGVVRWVGPYEAHELPKRMSRVDWVLVPSVWWENAPLVIQEAKACGRPVLASDIGGMAEAVDHGQDGLHVPAGDVQAWAETLRRCANDGELWERLAAGIVPPAGPVEWAGDHLGLLEVVRARTGNPR